MGGIGLKLGTKYWLLSFIGIVLTLLTIFTVTTYAFRTNLKEQMHADTKNALTLLVQEYRANEETVQAISSSLKTSYLNMTKATREILQMTNDFSVQALTELAETIDVAEIHVTDENGVLTYSNNVDVIGYDFRSAEQSAAFLEALENKHFELAQDPMPRGADGKFIMYTGIARLDHPGVIQLGIEPEEYEALVRSFDLEEIVQTRSFAKTGHTFIADEQGTIVAHPDRALVGQALSDVIPSFVTSEKEGELFIDDQYVQYVVDESGYIFFASVASSDYFDKLSDLQTDLLLYSVLWLLLLTIAMYVATRQIVTKPAEKMIAKLRNVAKGDLSVSFLSDRKDELGLISNHMDDMVSKLKTLLNGISESSMQVAGTSEQLSASGHNIAKSSAQIEKTLEAIAAHIDDQFDNIQDCTKLTTKLSMGIKNMTEAIEAISAHATRSSASSQEGNELVEKTTSEMQAMIAQVERTERVVARLNEKLAQIENVLEIINDITEQTNLLALNASIEAARAGDAGKGFAVVADEVRKLAEATVESTKRVAAIIDEVNREANEAVKIAQATNDAVHESAALVLKAGASFADIRRSIDDIAAQLETITSYIHDNEDESRLISDKMNELTSSSKSIVDSISTIKQAVSDHTETLADISEATDALTKMAEMLSLETEKYNLSGANE